MSSEMAPIVIFLYNRPQHSARMIESLLANPEAVNSPLFVFCDGPKTVEHQDAVMEVRKIAQDLLKSHPQVQFTFRDANIGLAASVIAGVTDVVNRYGKVIVLEDDLVLGPVVLNYFNRALELYEHSEKVAHVSGYMFPVKRVLPDTVFLPEMSCWGWATWKRAWANFNPNALELHERVCASGRKFEFDTYGSINFMGMLTAQIEGRINSWAIRWYATNFLLGKVALHPGQSLIANHGFDGTGVHCNVTDRYDVQPSCRQVKDFVKAPRTSLRALRALVQFRMEGWSRKNKARRLAASAAYSTPIISTLVSRMTATNRL